MQMAMLRIGYAALALSFLSFAPPFLAPCYPAEVQFTQIDVPGAAYTWASAINNHNEVTGGYGDQSGVTHGFLRTAEGIFTTFDPPGSTGTWPSSINEHGDIAGNFASSSGGFLRHADGKFEIFVSRKSVQPTAINGDREIVGILANNRYKRQGFLREEHSALSILPNLGSNVYVYGINNNGTIVGFTADDSGSTGFFRSADGTVTQFQAVPHGNYTQPAAINESGWIAGSTYGRTNQGFLRNPEGQITLIDGASVNAIIVKVTCLSNTNWIGGSYQDQYDQQHGYVRRPDGTIVIVDDPNAIVPGTTLLGINTHHFVVGYYVDKNNVTHGYIASVR
jgi:uncharacterized membrane protein